MSFESAASFLSVPNGSSERLDVFEMLEVLWGTGDIKAATSAAMPSLSVAFSGASSAYSSDIPSVTVPALSFPPFRVWFCKTAAKLPGPWASVPELGLTFSERV